MRIKIIADSTCDLGQALTIKHDIRVIPLHISMGERVLRDGVEVTSKEIFEFVESGKGMCRTSAVNVAEYADVYREERAAHDAVLHFVVSGEMSACYQNARLAAEEFDHVYVVDSRNLSTAIGHLVLDAAEMAAAGTAAEEIHREIIRRVDLLDASFVIDTLTYLHKGGRCTAIQALASGVFKIKPCIVVTDGKMGVGKKYRGRPERVLMQYIEDKLADKDRIDPRRIFVTHTMSAQNRALVEMVKGRVAELIPFGEIYETSAGGTISCHCGPNTLGILFFRKSL